jgi:hypothetical protein
MVLLGSYRRLYYHHHCFTTQMNESKTTPPTPLQSVLRILKAPDADAAQRLLDMLDARYVRIPSGSNGAAVVAPEHAPSTVAISDAIAIFEPSAAPATAKPTTEPFANGGGAPLPETPKRAPWDRWTLEQIKYYIDRDGYSQPMNFLRGIAGMCATTLDEVERRSHGSAYTLLVDTMLAEVAGNAAADTKPTVKPRWDRATIEAFLRSYVANNHRTKVASERVSVSGLCSTTLAEIVRRYEDGQNHTGLDAALAMLAELEAPAPPVASPSALEVALVSALDEVWGPDELVDINVEDPERDYPLVLAELNELAKKSRGNHHTFELNGHLEEGGFIAADPSKWVNGLHKPTLEAVAELLYARNRELCVEKDKWLERVASKSRMIGDLHCSKLFDAESALDEVLRLTNKIDNLSRPEPK